MARKKILMMMVLLGSIKQATKAHNGVGLTRTSVNQYVQRYSPLAVKHMQSYGIPASIILAQGILESAYGNSRMARQANNHFGIKCLGWEGEGYYQTNRERECYRKYASVEESFQDHARIISTKKRYAFLFRLKKTDYKSWAWGLKKAGYAQNNAYAVLLIKTIESYGLYRFDPKDTGPKTKQSVQQNVVKTEQVKAVNTPVELVLPNSQSLTEYVFSDFEEEQIITEDSIVENTLADSLPEEDEAEILIPITGLNYLLATEGQTLEQVAAELKFTLTELMRWNDLTTNKTLTDNEVIYLQPKNEQADIDMFTLRTEQTLWEVAQQFGVKLKAIEKLNKLKGNQKLQPGTVLLLRK